MIKLYHLLQKSEKYWVVFCVHDDTFALLEGYSEPKFAPSHMPEWTISLQNTQHISHALVPQENEFEFVITLMNEVARFNAASWDCMLEWVEALRSKLREMKILSPRENVYSKLPEIRPPLLPTRDPTSPLPVLPPVPPACPPGVEIFPASTSHGTRSTSTASQSVAMSNTNVQNIMNLLSNPLNALNHVTNGTNNVEIEREAAVTTIVSTTESQSTSRNIPETSEESANDETIVENDDSEAAATNITIIQVSTPPGEKTTVFDFTETPPDEDYRSNVQIIPSNPMPVENAPPTEIVVRGKPNIYKTPHKSKTKISAQNSQVTQQQQQVTTVQVSSSTANEYGQVFSCSSAANTTTVVDLTRLPSSQLQSQHYEQICLSVSAAPSSVVDQEEPSTSSGIRNASSPIRNNNNNNKRSVEVQPNSATRPTLQRGVTEVSITRPSRRDDVEPQTSNNRSTRKNTPANQADKFRGENHQQRQRSSSTSDMHASTNRGASRTVMSPVLPENRLKPAPQPYRNNGEQNMTRMTLREQQVIHLRREMMYPGGVRLQLRRKDCCGSIAWIDAFGGVWVAGWKQKEHPVLYNALHIGDQLISIAGTAVTSAADANKLIRACQGLFVSRFFYNFL